MKKKAIVFDIDGLMVDTEVYYTKSWQMGLEKYGKIISDEEVHSYSGLNWRIVSKMLAEKYNDEALAQNVVEEREVILHDVIEQGLIETKPYAYEMLNWAKEQGYRLAVASSGKKVRARRILEKLDLLPFFEFCIYGDDVERNKPYPDCYLEAVQRLGLEKEDVVAVEDSLTGAHAATAAGLDVIIVPDANLHQDLYDDETLSDIQVFAQGKDLRVLKDTLEK